MVEPKIIVSDDYEEMAATYQCIEIRRLNDILESKGISEELRRDICTTYFFHSGVFLDQGKIKADGLIVFPQIQFVRREGDDFRGAIIEVYLESQYHSWHEMAHGDVDYVFDEGLSYAEED